MDQRDIMDLRSVPVWVQAFLALPVIESEICKKTFKGGNHYV